MTEPGTAFLPRLTHLIPTTLMADIVPIRLLIGLICQIVELDCVRRPPTGLPSYPCRALLFPHPMPCPNRTLVNHPTMTYVMHHRMLGLDTDRLMLTEHRQM